MREGGDEQTVEERQEKRRERRRERERENKREKENGSGVARVSAAGDLSGFSLLPSSSVSRTHVMCAKRHPRHHH